jgi:3-phosphoshikimate 1-carboxyvinyltransferase
MQEAITPVDHAIDATVVVPGSKSITNRALLLAALSPHPVLLEGMLFSDDTMTALSALQALGINLEVDQQKNTVTVEGAGGDVVYRNAEIYCHDAGTVARFFVPVLAALGGRYTVSASPQMTARPMRPLLAVLEQQGVSFEFLDKPYHLPFVMTSEGLSGGQVSLDISVSSQFLSGLLMAAPLAKTPLKVDAGALKDKPYVNMTARMIERFRPSSSDVILGFDPGVQSNQSPGIARHKTRGSNQKNVDSATYPIEPDASTASYFFAAAAVTCGKVTVPHLTRDALQGDTAFLSVLEKMGCVVSESEAGITVQGPAQLKGLGEVSFAGFSDTFMTLAAIAAFADSATTITGIAHTRHQESDRVESIATGLRALGVSIETTEDSITIEPGIPVGAKVSSCGDHRIAMSLSVVGLKVPGVVIEDAQAVKKTCPNFYALLRLM